MKTQDSNLVEIYKHLETFKKNSKVTYVEVLQRMGAVYIEVPYSYENFMCFGERQQVAICQAELLKLKLSPEIVSIHPEAFYMTKNESDVALFEIQINKMKSWFNENHDESTSFWNIWHKMVNIMDNRTKPYLELLSVLAKDLNNMKLDGVKYALRFDLYDAMKKELIAIQDNCEVGEKVKEEFKQLIDEIMNYQQMKDFNFE